MQRFNSWDLDNSADFWKTQFKPKDLIRVLAHANSVISQQEDAKILERYDINEIPDHTFGDCCIWVPLKLGKPFYNEKSKLYPWEYDIDVNWVYIDAIYDRHIDPHVLLQNKMDYTYKANSGRLCFRDKLNLEEDEDGYINLYISKGWYSSYRLYTEIGKLLDYAALDSTAYRDSIEPILAAFYLGPTYKNMLAVLNVLAGLPIAKYGDEKIISIENGVVTTDKYSYFIGDMHTTLTLDSPPLEKFQPLTDVVVLHTKENDPYWWHGRPCEIFGKYVYGTVMSNELRDFIMDKFLASSVSAVEYRQDRLGSYPLAINQAIKDLFYKAAPSKSDFLLVQSYNIGISYDTEEVIQPNYSEVHPRLYVNSIYGRLGDHDLGDNGDFGVSSDLIPYPVVNDTEHYTKGVSFHFHNHLWHILDKEHDAFSQFWRYYEDIKEFEYKVLVEPCYDCVYLRNTETHDWEDSIIKFIPERPDGHITVDPLDNHTPEVDDEDKAAEGMMFSSMNNVVGEEYMNDGDCGYLAIPSSGLYDSRYFRSWESENILVIDGKGATVANDETLPIEDRYTGKLYVPDIEVGRTLKTISVDFEADIPTPGAAVNVFYALGNSLWMPLPPDKTVRNISNSISFRIDLFNDTSVLGGNPTLKEFDFKISLAE